MNDKRKKAGLLRNSTAKKARKKKEVLEKTRMRNRRYRVLLWTTGDSSSSTANPMP
jgi:hypothetical protein